MDYLHDHYCRRQPVAASTCRLASGRTLVRAERLRRGTAAWPRRSRSVPQSPTGTLTADKPADHKEHVPGWSSVTLGTAASRKCRAARDVAGVHRPAAAGDTAARTLADVPWRRSAGNREGQGAPIHHLLRSNVADDGGRAGRLRHGLRQDSLGVGMTGRLSELAQAEPLKLCGPLGLERADPTTGSS